MNYRTAKRYLYEATVVRVVDGDTVRVDIDLGFGVWLRNQSVRLAGIDAPEPHTETRVAGDAATKFLEGLVLGVSALLETQDAGKGKFGRWLATIWLPGNLVSVNDQLVSAGHAVPSVGGRRSP